MQWKVILGFALWSLAGGGHADTLREVVHAAVTTNPALQAASDEARASAYDLLELQSEFQPEVNIFAEAGAQQLDDPNDFTVDSGDTKFAREVGLTAEYVLFDGARRANLVYANAARVDGNVFRLLDATETLALNATEAYIDVYRHLLLLATARRNLERHREIGSQVNALVAGGTLPLSERLQVQDRIRASQLLVIEVERQLADADARFARVVGRDRRGGLQLPAADVGVSSRAALESAAISRSHRVAIDTKNIDKVEYERLAGEAERLPRLSLNAGIRHGEDLDGVSGPETDTFVGFRLNWTLHRGGREARNRAAIERRNQAISERAATVRLVREMAAKAWNGYQSNLDQARVLDVQRGLNRRLVSQYRSEFEGGSRSLLDVLDVERSAFEVEFAHINAQASLAFSRYRMLAVQSRLGSHFGVAQAGVALAPNFEARARADTISVFRTPIPPLVRADER
jgi:adhesin transport system outer membrane protein